MLHQGEPGCVSARSRCLIHPATNACQFQSIVSGGLPMLVIPGFIGKDTCDGITRRELLRVGGSAVFGFSLANLFSWQQATAKQNYTGGPGFGKAKSVILVYLQGGPSHLDLWDPKDKVQDNVSSVFKA